MEISRENFRTMIFYDYKCNLTPKQCIDQLHLAFGDEAPSNRTVYNWFAEFQRGRIFLCDEFREGHPSTSVVATNVDAVREIIERDRHMTYREIQASLDIDMKAIHTILHDHLSVWKLYSTRQTIDFLSSKNVELMSHCPYSPDLSPNNFFLFPNIKKKMHGERFESPEAAVGTFRTLISEVTASEWEKMLRKLIAYAKIYRS
ncbi:FLJ37770-like protein [Acromyrmex echinatior]|uniref:FLJ37770-like protein n=1 Tax=Acromyrmex echinatior TaxID=103372 RepID=F4WS09_ACREC|nr:FLJ37770-like protein [Acromyrmex echinatior]